MTHISINGRRVGAGEPCYIIAEAADAHHGSTDMAIAMVDMAATAGADAIKFQHHIPHEEMLRFQTPSSDNMNEPLFDFLQRNALTLSQHNKVARYCQDVGIQYLCTPFSWAAAQEIAPLVPAFKVGSGEAQDFPYLMRLASYHKPLIVSTGMCNSYEVLELTDVLQTYCHTFALMHCVSEYPPVLSDLNIDWAQIPANNGHICGYSDHTPTIWTAIAAATLGASIIEKHITLSEHIRGPDAAVSINNQQLRDLVNAVRTIHKSRGYQKVVHERERPIRAWAYRSIVYTQDLKAGTVLTQDHLWSKRPGTGILSKRMPEFIGKALKIDVPKDRMLTEDDLCA
jgi:N-acetylneuraminate synthase